MEAKRAVVVKNLYSQKHRVLRYNAQSVENLEYHENTNDPLEMMSNFYYKYILIEKTWSSEVADYEKICIAECVSMLVAYKKFERKNIEIFKATVKTKLQSLYCGFELLLICLKGQPGTVPLLKIRALMIQAFESVSISNIFWRTAAPLINQFMQNHQFEIAEVLLILTAESIRIKIKKNDDSSKNLLNGVRLIDFWNVDLQSLKIDYLQELLYISSNLVDTENHHATTQVVFDKFDLPNKNKIMKALDISKWAKTLSEAEKLGELIIKKVQERIMMVIRHPCSANRTLQLMSGRLTIARIYSSISRFHPDEKKNVQILDMCVKLERDNPQEITRSIFQKYLKEYPKGTLYQSLMLAVTENYSKLIDIKCAAVVAQTPNGTARVEIESINSLVYRSIQDIEKYMEFADDHPEIFYVETKVLIIMMQCHLYLRYSVKGNEQKQLYYIKTQKSISRLIRIIQSDQQIRETFIKLTNITDLTDLVTKVLTTKDEDEAALHYMKSIFTDPYVNMIHGSEKYCN